MQYEGHGEQDCFRDFIGARLEAEAIRDSILFVERPPESRNRRSERISRRCRRDLGGLRPLRTYWRVDVGAERAREEDARRRSVYIFQRRSLPLPMMAAFDATAFQ